MKIKYGISVLTAAFAAMMTACSTVESLSPELDQQEILQMIEDVVDGELLVRFDSRVSDILDKAGLTKSGPATPASRSGVMSVDEILELVDGYQIERVFPVDVRSEEKARNDGLHLWYVVRFSKEHSVAKVAENLSKLGEVSRVEYNRTLKRAGTGEAKPLTKSSLANMTASAKSASFNDPHLGLQWHMVNNGDLGPVKFIAGADVQVEKAWELCAGDPSIVVAILDEGIDITHPDLVESLWKIGRASCRERV